MNIVVCTGGFDPIHSGHIKYFSAARKLGEKLIVGLNSDEWLVRKKGKAFMPFVERKAIVSNLKDVDDTMAFDDTDGSAVKLLEDIKKLYPNDQIIFANGGDRNAKNIPETIVKDVIFEFGVGGEDKSNSSSWILEEWKAPKIYRDWGYYRVLHTDGPEIKLKELTVDPNKCLSMQLHNQRNELWFVSSGEATLVSLLNDDGDHKIEIFPEQNHLEIPMGTWHQLCNNTNTPLKIIEIQFGSNCIEEDIVRRFKIL